MGDKPSTSLSPGEDPPAPPSLPTTFWRRISRRLYPVEVVDRHQLRRPLRNAEEEPPAPDDPDGPTPPKRECPPPDQEEQQKDRDKEKEKDQEKEKRKQEEREKAEKEKAEKEKAEKEKAEQEKAEKERAEKEKAEKERAEKEKEKEKDKEEPYECPLCLESVRQRNPVTTKCGHIFCQQCLETALRRARKCPMCKARVKQNPFIRIYM